MTSTNKLVDIRVFLRLCPSCAPRTKIKVTALQAKQGNVICFQSLSLVAGAGFRRHSALAYIEIKDFFEPSQMAASGVWLKRQFIDAAWDIGPKAAAA